MAGGAFLSGLAGGLGAGTDLKNRNADRALREREVSLMEQAYADGGRGVLDYVPSGGGTGGGGKLYSGRNGASARSGGGGGGPARLKVQDPVATDLPPEARAFLNGVSAGESAGAYNIRYTPDGGKTFDISGGHPRIYEDGPHGKSSAAGRYQFTYDTWKDYGGNDFSEAAQDRAAWQLAQDRYQAETGGDLLATLRSDGMTPRVQAVLTPTWQALKGNRQRWQDVYNDSLARYTSADTVARDTRPARRPDPSPQSVPPAPSERGVMSTGEMLRQQYFTS